MRPTSALPLATVLALLPSIQAVDVLFQRYSQPECPNNFHIAKDTHLHDPHCKTFDKDEPPFESFKVTIEDHGEDLLKKLCQVTVYDQRDCKGNGFTMDDLAHSKGLCGDPTVAGRSVKVTCGDKPQSIATSIPPTSTPARLFYTPVSTVLTTTISVPVHEDIHSPTGTRTITLEPAPSHDHDCDCWEKAKRDGKKGRFQTTK